MLRVFLPRLAGWNAARREAAARYAELGLGELVETPADEPGHVYHMYVVRSRSGLRSPRRSPRRGIASASYYVTPLHLQPALAYLGWPRASLPETERAAAENLALPMWGGIDPSAAGASRRDGALGARRARVGMRSPVNRHRLWQVAVDAALDRGCVDHLLVRPLRRGLGRVYYDRYLEWDVVVLVVGVTLPVFIAFGFYNRWWRYVSTQDMWGVAARGRRGRGRGLPRLHAPRLPPGEGPARDLGHRPAAPARVRHGGRGSSRARSSSARRRARSSLAAGRCIIVGAGDAAQLILREMLKNPSLGYTPIGLVDDDPRKKNLRLHGVRVLGTTASSGISSASAGRTRC